MAFENVFGQVDFRTPERARAREQQQFIQMLGMGMQAAQNAREMDMRERQLEAKANEINLKKTAEAALLKKNMGMPVTPQEDAAIKTMGQIAPPSYTTDEFGRAIARPSGWASFVAGGVNNTLSYSGAAPVVGKRVLRVGDTGYGQGTNRALTQNYEDITPAMLLSDEEDIYKALDAPLPAPEYGAMTPAPQGFALPPTPNYQGSPAQEIKAGEAKIGLKEYAAKKNIDLSVLNEEQKLQLAFEMKKADAEIDRAKRLGRPSKLAESSIMIEDIGRALDILSSNEGFLPKTGTVGSVIDYFPETKAGQLASQLKSVQNLVGFGKLAGMREKSPTGSSGLGSLSEQEMEGLKSTSGNLEVKQRKEDLEYNLKRLHNQQMDLVHGTPEHIAKVAQEKNLPPEIVNQLSMRYDLSKPKKRRRFNPQTGMLE